jgi:hypothetical protein
MQREAPAVMAIRSVEDIEAAFGAPTRPERKFRPEAVRTPEQALGALNCLPVWDGRIIWASFSRRGNTLTGTTSDGEQVRFDVDKLTRFAHAQSRILDALGVGIRSPRRGQIGETWLVAAELMMRAVSDTVDAGAPEDDLRADLVRCWRLAGEPQTDRERLAGLLWVLKYYRREPYPEAAPAAVFLYAGEVCTYLPVLREWLSTPAGGNRRLTLPVLREQAGLIGLKPREVDVEGEQGRLNLTLWTGPAEALGDE